MLDVEVGYVRVPKREQNPELQRRELSAAGCERIFEERISSREESRPQLEAALDYCHRGTCWWYGGSSTRFRIS
ncbi:MAG: recombinase family protein [Actinomycetota bacterium]|nr:recombinase family protein [Actinomycetota bacterium]